MLSLLEQEDARCHERQNDKPNQCTASLPQVRPQAVSVPRGRQPRADFGASAHRNSQLRGTSPTMTPSVRQVGDVGTAFGAGKVPSTLSPSVVLTPIQ